MRDILFRAKRLTKGNWIESSSVIFVDRKTNVYFGNDCADVHTVSDIKTGDIYEIGSDDDVYSFLKVDPATVGQYTGLKDDRGRKIFEGDIMEFWAYGEHYKGVVELEEGNSGVMCRDASPFLDDAVSKYSAVVIGNRYDNPELMEVTDETD